MREHTVRQSAVVEIFGSNRQGSHSDGHARHCSIYRGAQHGVGEGRTGMAYALPVKEAPYSKQRLPDTEITEGVARLYAYVRANPRTSFIAGWVADDDVIPALSLAGEVPPNMRWPNTWMQRLAPTRFRPTLIVAGSRSLGEVMPDRAREVIAFELDDLRNDFDMKPSIISGTARGPDRWGIEFARQNNVNLLMCPAEWDLWGRQSGFIRNHFMGLLGARLTAFSDGSSTGTNDMIEFATGRMPVRTVLGAELRQKSINQPTERNSP